LQEKRQHIPRDKDLGQPLLLDQRPRLAIQQQYNPAKLHVDGSSEQSRRNKKENRLDDVRAQRPVGALGTRFGTGGVADELNCSKITG
jgi:hypothetical protein